MCWRRRKLKWEWWLEADLIVRKWEVDEVKMADVLKSLN